MQRSGAGESASPDKVSGPARYRIYEPDDMYSFDEYLAAVRARAKKVYQRFAVTELRYAEYLRERQAVLEATSPGVVLNIGAHGPGDPTLDKQGKLEALRQEYREDIRRHHVVHGVLDWLAQHDPDAAKLVDLCYWQGRSRAWIVTHGDEAGVYVSDRTIGNKLVLAKDALCEAFGWLAPEVTGEAFAVGARPLVVES
jgi:hypothetical protein